MKLYLSSYKLGNETVYLKNWLERNNRQIAVIPNARDVFPDGKRKVDGITENCVDLESLGFETSILDLREYFSHPNHLEENLSDKRAFFVLGGNTFTLRAAMRLSSFDKYLKKYQLRMITSMLATVRASVR